MYKQAYVLDYYALQSLETSEANNLIAIRNLSLIKIENTDALSDLSRLNFYEKIIVLIITNRYLYCKFSNAKIFLFNLISTNTTCYNFLQFRSI